MAKSNIWFDSGLLLVRIAPQCFKLCTSGLTSPITDNKDNNYETHLCAGELILSWRPVKKKKKKKKKNLYY